MKCPYCNKKGSEVLESRVINEGVEIRRRRICKKCGKRFTTHEKIAGETLWVVKKGGARESWDREKVKRGILRAIQKRPVSMDLVNDVVLQVEREMRRKGNEEIPSKAIGTAVLRRLKKIDKVAWLRFASVYLEFEDLTDFEKVIEKEIK
ncbi:transcriptional repressor NrdR [Candidatus Woesebacteria bacterium]|nr:transcriptional repressor NrdR [Candidatus Woesebacteria bacterium]QQG47580.1 MAG: transcriptional repressor NrdR [Candidatus Woesebacteria bacterium]